MSPPQPTEVIPKLAVDVNFFTQDIDLANSLAKDSTSKVAVIFRAGIDLYNEILRLRDENKLRKTVNLKFVEGNRVSEDSEKYLSLDLYDEFPAKLFPRASSTSRSLQVFLTEENNRLVQRLAQSSGVDYSTVLRAGLYLYKAIIQAEEQGCTLGITEGDEVIHIVVLKPLDSE
jgi:hypothetical protein